MTMKEPTKHKTTTMKPPTKRAAPPPLRAQDALPPAGLAAADTGISIVRTKIAGDSDAITMMEYGGLQAAFDFLNAKLFGGKLPDAFIIYSRKPRMLGHFAEDRYSGRVGEFKKPEIALNPDAFIGQTDERIVSTLTHEMKHLEQYRFGKPSARGYHNKQWAAAMKAIGLMPSNTGAVGGKETGQQMDHYIVPGGPYQLAFAELAATGWKLNLQSTIHAGGTKKVDESKTKFTCPVCGWIVRGKPDTVVVHMPCGCEMVSEHAVTEAVASSYEQQAAE
jgi:SprT-like family